MKAVVYVRPGPPECLEYREVAKPVPARGQVLVRVCAASLNALDWRRFAPLPDRTHVQDRPQVSWIVRLLGAVFGSHGTVLGADIAGVVDTVGEGVMHLRTGDEVFGVALGSRGGFADFACAREAQLARKPQNLSFAQAAAVPVAALTALQAVRTKGRLQSGQRLLVYGSSGGVGTYAVQLGKALGAHVSAVTSARGASLAQSLGAERVIDYAREDFAAGGESFDLVVAVNGGRSLFDFRRALAPRGRCVVVGGSVGLIAQAAFVGPLLSLVGRKRLGFMGIAKMSGTDLALLADMLSAETIAPVIDRVYSLSETAAAVRYVAGGHARGKVVLTNEPTHEAAL